MNKQNAAFEQGYKSTLSLEAITYIEEPDDLEPDPFPIEENIPLPEPTPEPAPEPTPEQTPEPTP